MPRIARVMSTGIKKDLMDEAIAEWRVHLEPYKKVGMQKAIMLVNRETGEYLSISVWESAEAQAKNVSSPAQTAGREAMTKKYFTGPPKPSTFEVAVIIE